MNSEGFSDSGQEVQTVVGDESSMEDWDEGTGDTRIEDWDEVTGTVIEDWDEGTGDTRIEDWDEVTGTVIEDWDEETGDTIIEDWDEGTIDTVIDDWGEVTGDTAMKDWDGATGDIIIEDWDKESEATEDWDDGSEFAPTEEIDELLHFNGKQFEELTFEDVKDIEFKDINEAERFYSRYSRVIGFSIRRHKLDKGIHGNVLRRQWVCSRQGKRRAASKENRIRNPNQKQTRTPRKVTRKGCLAAFTVRHNKNSGRLFVSQFITKHTHKCVDAVHAHFLRSHRVVRSSAVAQVKSMNNSSIKTSRAYDFMVHQAGGYENVGFTLKDLYNKLDIAHRETLLDGDAQAAISWANSKATKDPGFFCEYSVDSAGRLANFFWRDAVSFLDYHHFGDVLVFDSTYKTNVYGMPLALFVGSNNHRGTVVFGCALLVDETITTYTWILQKFLYSMRGKQPISVLTDGDPAMRRAVMDVLPQSRHRLCSWHVSKNLFENIKDSNVYPDFGHCLYESLTLDEWEAAWRCMIEKHGLQKNSWINGMYAKRELWAESFFRGYFYGAMCSTQRCEGMHKDLKEGADRHARLYEIMPRMDRTFDRLRNNVKNDEYNSMSSEPDLTSHLRSLERQIAEIYTHDIYLLIKDQIELEIEFIIMERLLYEGSTVYYLSQYDHPERRWTVAYHHNASPIQLLCSCKMFECDGIPCCHLFTVMKVEQVKVYPKSLVRKRWTKEATKDVEIPECVGPSITGDVVSRTARHGGLAAQCDRICYNGSLSPEGYKVVKNALDTLSLSSERFRVECEETSKASGFNNNALKDPINVVKDPIIAKTKGKWAKTMGKGVKKKVDKGVKAKRGRKVDKVVKVEKEKTSDTGVKSKAVKLCSICRFAGHNCRKCPQKDIMINKEQSYLSTQASDGEGPVEIPDQNNSRPTSNLENARMDSSSVSQFHEGESSQSTSWSSDNSASF